MIDIENIVLNTVYEALKAEYPNITFYGEYVEAPASFPCVCLVEDDNSTYQASQDTSLQENNAELLYTLNVYSNKQIGKKAEAKKIANMADMVMQNMKFTRTMLSQIPNVDRSIYRVTARYSAVVAKGTEDGENTVFQMYRR